MSGEANYTNARAVINKRTIYDTELLDDTADETALIGRNPPELGLLPGGPTIAVVVANEVDLKH